MLYVRRDWAEQSATMPPFALLLVLTFWSAQFAGSPAISTGAAAANPGFVVRLSLVGINRAANETTNAFTAEVIQLLRTLPDKQKLFSGGTYYLKNFRLEEFHLPQSVVTLKPGIGVVWSLNNASFSLSFDWSYSYQLYFVFQDAGKARVSIKDVSISVKIVISANKEGKPNIYMSNCLVAAYSISVNIDGSAFDWIYELMANILEEMIKDQLTAKICVSVRTAIGKHVSTRLSQLKMSQVIANKLLLDYRLIANPTFQADYIETYHSGKFQLIGDRRKSAFTAPELDLLPPSSNNSSLLTLVLSKYMLDTLFESLSRSNSLLLNITERFLPPSASMLLRTACNSSTLCLGRVFPQITSRFPGVSGNIVVKESMLPKTTVDENYITLTTEVLMTVVVSKLNNTKSSTITVSLTISAAMTAFLSNNRICGNLSNAHFTIRSVKSKDFQLHVSSSLENLNKYLAVLLDFIVPECNKYLNAGFELPSLDGEQYDKPAVRFTPNAIIISTNGITDIMTDAFYDN